ncbi:hypothetical protein PCASD_21984 [Puccinia coronata f. sp. avenae]|uniref:Tet-like 2OG-Fe(II) oxygenase domain-containing protein n=1 Tax=Puccinia coronata f. sp. avenae TaxID=200324 RepID=A0A2N5U393_9BASI|nr:hypothetical protein PCASD_21984 [Puccinia coronata f. sp. avenae]
MATANLPALEPQQSPKLMSSLLSLPEGWWPACQEAQQAAPPDKSCIGSSYRVPGSNLRADTVNLGEQDLSTAARCLTTRYAKFLPSACQSPQQAASMPAQTLTSWLPACQTPQQGGSLPAKSLSWLKAGDRPAKSQPAESLSMLVASLSRVSQQAGGQESLSRLVQLHPINSGLYATVLPPAYQAPIQQAGGQPTESICRLVASLPSHSAGWWPACRVNQQAGGQPAESISRLVASLSSHSAGWWTACQVSQQNGGQPAESLSRLFAGSAYQLAGNPLPRPSAGWQPAHLATSGLSRHSKYSLSAHDPGPDPLLEEEVLTWLIQKYKKLELFWYQASKGSKANCRQAVQSKGNFIPLDELMPEQLNDLGTVSSAKDNYDSLMCLSYKPSAILGKNFQDVANIAFEANCELMAENYIPAFCSLHYQDPLQELNCFPNVTFTTSGFYNPPHKDTGDAQEFAFLLFLPINNHDGSLIQSTDEYHVKGGAFVFLDYHFGIDFSKHNGIVKVVWPS